MLCDGLTNWGEGPSRPSLCIHVAWAMVNAVSQGSLLFSSSSSLATWRQGYFGSVGKDVK